MLYMFFELWSIPFIFLLGVEVIALSFFLNFVEESSWVNHRYKGEGPAFGGVFALFVIFFSMWCLLGDGITVLKTIEPIKALIWAGIYFLFGGVFSVFRWAVHISRFVKYVKKLDVAIKLYTPVSSDNKDLIFSWIAFWPLYLIGYLLNSPFKKICSAVFHLFRGIYDRIGRSMTASIAHRLKDNT